ncbi:splicing factor 3B subunit 2-like [Ostrea edulis]|uniref:splicing factor 3B subunit 2-like n=1 Tax=Ostrea edulis TaxID=37623 RepID=UPI0024AF82E9|nr:splicing factor 3B subunit 2-like [Ostrea edulis]
MTSPQMAPMPPQMMPRPPLGGPPPRQPFQIPTHSATPQPPEPKDHLDSDPEFQRKLAIQRQLINEEEQKKKEAAALAQKALLLSQRGGPGASPALPSGDLMEKVRQQQVMIEMEKQESMRQMQEKAINQAEQDLRLKEAELLRQQQIALMEAQREAQEKRMQEQQQPPGPPIHVAPSQPPLQQAVVPPPPGLAVPPQQGTLPMNIPGQGTMPQQPASMPAQVPMQAPPVMPTQVGVPPQVTMTTPMVPPGTMVTPQRPVGPGMMMPTGGQQGLLPPGTQTVPPGMQIPVTHPPMLQGPPPPGTQTVPPGTQIPVTHPPMHQGPPPPGTQTVPPGTQIPVTHPPMHQGPPPPGTQTVPPGTQIPVTHPPMHQGPPPPGTQPVSTQPQPQERPPTSVPIEMEKQPPPQLESGSSKEIKLPQALEKVLAFKDVRAQEVGVTHEEIEQMNTPMERDVDEEDASEDVGYGTYDMEEEEEEGTKTGGVKESKNKKRKKKKKKAKKNRLLQQQQQQPSESPAEDVQVEYIQEQLELDPTDPNYFIFSKIFEAFKISEEKKEEKVDKKEDVKKENIPLKKEEEDKDEDSDDDAPVKKEEDDGQKLSKKKLKKMTRLSVAQLKQLVSRPDVVEMHDVTAQDPRLLVHLKATRNTVPVPRHWCFKRKYLQGKRGIEKPPFELPDYIKATGIMEMREALAEKEDQKNLKAKMREKVRPKMGKIDIDYQKLHDAFFRWQTKPKMTIHGDLYYEGKEFETRLKEKKPGNLSDELKTALGMPLGHNSEKFPPPWLIAMQRYGPPPSYPNLKIPGLSAPIPESCSFGYHAGGWGKPPVDENGKPLYGDVFGTQSSEFQTPIPEEDVDKSLWGEMDEESSSEEESEEEEEEEEDASGLVTPGPEGLVTPSGITSVPMGMETPDMIELRKKRIEDAMDQGGETPALYTILPEKKSSVGGAMMGSAHVYDTTAVIAGKKDKPGTEGIEVALNPEELDLDTAAMQAKYDQTMREQQSQLEKEDLSDMVAEHAAKQKKRKKQQQDSGKAAKKYKEFKF